MAGYSPWGCKESDMTEQLSTHTKIYSSLLLRAAKIEVYIPNRIIHSFNKTRKTTESPDEFIWRTSHSQRFTYMIVSFRKFIPGKTEIAQRGAGKQEETQSSAAFHMRENKQEERLMLLKKNRRVKTGVGTRGKIWDCGRWCAWNEGAGASRKIQLAALTYLLHRSGRIITCSLVCQPPCLLDPGCWRVRAPWQTWLA